jgi:metal-responsive CopG/Arc/MetJ family transcriptional regulator
MTQISISLPERIVDEVDRLAALENRNRSNFIANYLKRLTESQ